MFKERLISGTRDVNYGTTFPNGFAAGGGWIDLWSLRLRPRVELKAQLQTMWANYVNSPKTNYAPGWSSLNAKETFFSTEARRPVWNTCYHTKTGHRYNYPTAYVVHQLNYQCYGTAAWDANPSYSNLTAPAELEPSPFVRARAWADLQPRFESDFQALNFVFELKDFRGLGKQMLSGLRKAAKYNRQLDLFTPAGRRKAPGKGTPTCRQAFNGGVNSLASGWLLNSMAIQPSLKDIAAFRAAIVSEYLDALKQFQADGEKPNTRHYSEHLERDETVVWESNNPIYRRIQRRHIDRTTFTAHLNYQYKYNLTDNAEAFARYWGMTGTAEEFWNMLPFSFLIDYVFTVAKALKRTEIDRNLDLSVLDYWESIFSTSGQHVGYLAEPVNSSGYIIDGNYYSPDGVFRPYQGIQNCVFNRYKSQPEKYGLTLPQWKLPTVGQGWNAGALAKLLLFR